MPNLTDILNEIERLQALSIANVVQQSEQLSCETCKFNCEDWDDDYPCANCACFDFWKAT